MITMTITVVDKTIEMMFFNRLFQAPGSAPVSLFLFHADHFFATTFLLLLLLFFFFGRCCPEQVKTVVNLPTVNLIGWQRWTRMAISLTLILPCLVAKVAVLLCVGTKTADHKRHFVRPIRKESSTTFRSCQRAKKWPNFSQKKTSSPGTHIRVLFWAHDHFFEKIGYKFFKVS